MDGLSNAASVIAVASLAIQLVDSVQKLLGFLDSIQDAPNNIHTIATKLRLLSEVLENIESHERQYGQNSITTGLLESCREHIDALTKIVQKVQPGFESGKRLTRKWSALRAVLKKDDLDKFNNHLQEMIQILSLAQQSSMRETSILHHESQKQTLSAIMQKHESHEQTLSAVLQKHESQGQSLSIIAQKMEFLQLQQTAPSCTATLTTGTSLDEHIADLRATFQGEMRELKSLIPNPMYRSRFEIETSRALQQILASLPKADVIQTPAVGTTGTGAQNCAKPAEEVNSTETRTGLNVSQITRKTVHCSRGTTSTMFCKFDYEVITYNVYHASLSPDLPYSTEFKSWYRVQPAWWLTKLGIKTGLNVRLGNAIQGWQHSLKPFTLVPDDALIFKFIKDGNLRGVQLLLAEGKASARDTNSKGETPLHLAVEYGTPDICRLLLDAGADVHARDNYYRTPIERIYYYFNVNSLQSIIATLRILQRHWNLSDPKDPGWWTMHTCLSFAFRAGPGSDSFKVLTAAIEFSYEDIFYYLDFYQAYSSLWFLSSENYKIDTLPREIESYLDKICSFGDEVNERGVSLLHLSAMLGSPVLKQLVRRSSNLRIVGEDWSWGHRSQTPTSLAMLSSARFWNWKAALLQARIDLKAFVKAEIETGVLASAGWSEEALMGLFELEFASGSYGKKCQQCGYPMGTWDTAVEVSWLCYIGDIKIRRGGNSSKSSSGHEGGEDVTITELGHDRNMNGTCEENIKDAEEIEVEQAQCYINKVEHGIQDENISEDEEVITDAGRADGGGPEGWLCDECWNNHPHELQSVVYPPNSLYNSFFEILAEDEEEDEEDSPFLVSIPL